MNYISNGSVDRWQNEVLTTDFVTDIETTTNVGFDVNNLNIADRVRYNFMIHLLKHLLLVEILKHLQMLIQMMILTEHF